MRLNIEPFGRALKYFSQPIADGLSHLAVHNSEPTEKGACSLERLVNELVDEHQVAGSDLLAE
jgi:hypothetical protein